MHRPRGPLRRELFNDSTLPSFCKSPFAFIYLRDASVVLLKFHQLLKPPSQCEFVCFFSPLFFIFFISFLLVGGYFTILQWVLSYIKMNQPWVYMCSPSRSPLPPPSPPDPSRSSQCTRSEHLSHASNLGW